MSIVSLEKNIPVRLTKDKPGDGRPNTLDMNLGWTTGPDVDLGLLFQLKDGSKGVVQALGTHPDRFGNLFAPPFAKLFGDDLTGQKQGGGHELLQVNLDHSDQIERMLLFAYVYKGGNWGDVKNGAITITHPLQGNFDFELGKSSGMWARHRNALTKTCALMLLQPDDDGYLTLVPQEKYLETYREIGPQQALDLAYGWGLTWTIGYKS